jgi:hypothetical protein
MLPPSSWSIQRDPQRTDVFRQCVKAEILCTEFVSNAFKKTKSKFFSSAKV